MPFFSRALSGSYADVGAFAGDKFPVRKDALESRFELTMAVLVEQEMAYSIVAKSHFGLGDNLTVSHIKDVVALTISRN